MGAFSLCAAIVLFLGMTSPVVFIPIGIIRSDPAAPKSYLHAFLSLILFLPLSYLFFYLLRNVIHQIYIGMYYYTYVGRDEIRWGDMFQHQSVSVSELAKVHIDSDGLYMELTLNNGKTFKVENRFLANSSKALYERIKLIDNIKVDYS